MRNVNRMLAKVGDLMKYLVALLVLSVSIPAYSQIIASFRGDAQHSGIYKS